MVKIALYRWCHCQVPRHTSTRAPFLCRWIPPGKSFHPVGGVYSAREQNSSVGGDTGYVCLGVHMEEEVQDRVQVEFGREEQSEGKIHGKEQSEEQRSNEKQSTAHHGRSEDDMTRACRHVKWLVLSHVV